MKEIKGMMKKSIAAFCLSICLSLLLVTNTLANVINIEDMVGVWGSSEDDGKTFWGFDQYQANGRLMSWGTLPDSEESFELVGTYQLITENAMSVNCITIIESSRPDVISPGTQICSLITKLNNSVMHYIDEEGQLHVLYKQNTNQRL
jgi:hypothetical protein